MQQQAYQGYVIHTRAYRETSMLVDFFTLESGRISAVAKGARRVKSEKKSLLQPLQLLQFYLSGRSSLRTLGALESLQKSHVLQHYALYSAFYLNEIISRALPEAEPCEALYQQYVLSLNALAQFDQSVPLQSIEIVLREFELVLLEELGYMPDLSFDNQAEIPVNASLGYIYREDEGMIYSNNQQAFLGADLMQIEAREWSPSSLRAAKRLTRLALRPIIGNKPIKSRELFSFK